MKLNYHSKRNQKGVALITVLSVLVVLTALVLAFFFAARSETDLSNNRARQADADSLADTVLQFVIGQIRTATTTGNTQCWASQAGAISTFDTSGNLVNIYKLYSSDVQVTTAKLNLTNELPATNFGYGNRSYSAYWTDLNDPVVVSSNATSNATIYPIVDPGAYQKIPTTDVQGFIFPYTGTGGRNPVYLSNQTQSPLPMPVKWLYVLNTGDIRGSTATGSFPNTFSKITLQSAPAAPAGGSLTGRIVGRIAFWTDDDSCKVNINTASEGTYWDTPYEGTQQNQILDSNQPLQKEFQRYPGHPATTSLTAVFPWAKAEDIYQWVPRVVGGGSMEGSNYTLSAANTNLIPDSDRLYDSVDEFLYSANKTASTRSNQTSSSAQNITSSVLETSRFFLTAHSRAPEVTLFGTPRVACWPIDTSITNPVSPRVTAFDRLIAFCSTIGNQTQSYPYYFQRANATSSTSDIGLSRNQVLLTYLQNLTSRTVPGFNGDFATKYGTDSKQIVTEIFDYIRCTNLTDANLAGVSAGNFTNAFCTWSSGTSPDAYVAPAKDSTTNTMGFGRACTLTELGLVFFCNMDATNSTNNALSNTNNATVPFTGSDPNLNAAWGPSVETGRNPNGATPIANGHKVIQCFLLPQLNTTMIGYPATSQETHVKITGLDAFTVSVNGGAPQNLGFPAAPEMDFGGGINGNSGGNPASYMTVGASVSWHRIGQWPSGGAYPFYGKPVDLNVGAATTMQFTGGVATVSIYTKGGTGNPIQTLKIKVPNGTFPIPNLATNGYNIPGGNNPAGSFYDWWWLSMRVYIRGNPVDPQFDVVRSILPRHGDFRLIAANPNLDDSAGLIFKPHPNYGNATTRIACRYGTWWQTDGQGDAADSLAARFDWAGSNYQSDHTQALPDNFSYFLNNGDTLSSFCPNWNPHMYPSANGTPPPAADRPEATGDFDGGTVFTTLGSFVNKPDEGCGAGANGFNNNILSSYFNRDQTLAVSSVFNSPNRIMISPGMFGSLPTRVLAGVPWQTLLFRPQGSDFPSNGQGSLQHPSTKTAPPDHLFMDLFWMPVVEPYAISEPFSTAGKINLNYQIMPFTYIKRATGLYAVMKNEMMTAIPDTAASVYRYWNNKNANGYAFNNGVYRFSVNMTATLAPFDTKFSGGNIFKSATEICDMHIVPNDPGNATLTAATMPGYWSTHRLTSDNLRERIYTRLYPRLTVKSNTFTVHYRVQTLKQVSRPLGPTDPAWNTWDESKDKVLAEQRGSFTVERYVDPNDSRLTGVDFAANPTNTIDQYYRFRVVDHHKFAP